MAKKERRRRKGGDETKGGRSTGNVRLHGKRKGRGEGYGGFWAQTEGLWLRLFHVTLSRIIGFNAHADADVIAT